jgi:pyridoxal phosphate enzyme (YggS family)
MEKRSLETVEKNLEDIIQRVKVAAEASGRSYDDVKILAATKTVDPDTINFVISKGVKYIGENRVQELLEKYDSINKDDVEIHFIGRLQTNKVKYIIDKVSLIHSVDSFKLAKEIDRQAAKHGKVMDILVEVNAGDEESKGGVSAEETLELVKEISSLPNVCIKGLMTIPPKCMESSNINEECGRSKKIYKNKEFFDKILKLFLDISSKKLDNIYMYELSAGMSDDYECAVECGSTIIRPGRVIFGSRL